ncbi:hypothetical protein Ga0074812_11337 [Parafrankia irregularis]|uniref:Uncharacterized protein n=1 Tax=Parafrankia irregularis TaxID=795642 RepID=A0A0S4QQ15_9ACTN|nr:hypothetical protein Ga0074812_11337 [Parafrankia irregularis]
MRGRLVVHKSEGFWSSERPKSFTLRTRPPGPPCSGPAVFVECEPWEPHPHEPDLARCRFRKSGTGRFGHARRWNKSWSAGRTNVGPGLRPQRGSSLPRTTGTRGSPCRRAASSALRAPTAAPRATTAAPRAVAHVAATARAQSPGPARHPRHADRPAGRPSRPIRRPPGKTRSCKSPGRSRPRVFRGSLCQMFSTSSAAGPAWSIVVSESHSFEALEVQDDDPSVADVHDLHVP